MADIVNYAALKSGLLRFDLDLGPLMAKLDELPNVVRNKFVRGALRDSLIPTMNVARAIAPRDTGRLAENIRIRPGKTHGTKITVLVSSMDKRRKAKLGASESTYYGYFAEKGFKHYLSKKDVPGKHYMERAFEQTESIFTANVEAFLSEALRQYFV
ncbi:HK97 gp10 family phage protein [Paludisphaera borealis]|uniref:Uncharacterized protein n=1 Tax=Paludisphaera borealis TaxID=1387353 RepID=A0A1U7CX64_9BACT|nr:hypothetical protein [Paludisphaera borealis]APW63537.1 hypothetical protein BSF38_05109 [Paludisphaera borealis]